MGRRAIWGEILRGLLGDTVNGIGYGESSSRIEIKRYPLKILHLELENNDKSHKINKKNKIKTTLIVLLLTIMVTSTAIIWLSTKWILPKYCIFWWLDLIFSSLQRKTNILFSEWELYDKQPKQMKTSMNNKP